MIVSISGCSKGSPPLIVTMAVFRYARRSMRRIISSVGIGRRKIVVFVAVGASQIASANRNDVGQKHMLSGCQSPNDHLDFAAP